MIMMLIIRYKLIKVLMLKINKIVKSVCFYVILISTCRWRAFPHASVANIATFPSTSLILRLNGLNRQDKISFGAMLSPNIPSLRASDKLQSFTRNLRQTLVFMWNSKIRESFNFYFQQFFTSINKFFIFTGRLSTRL